MAMKDNELDLLKELKNYSQKELLSFSNKKTKEQMSSEIKSMYEKYGVDPNKTHNFSQLDELQKILSRSKSHPNEMAQRLFKKKMQKSESQNNKSSNQDKENKTHHRSFTVCLDELKNYSDEQLKNFYSNKLLTHGWSIDEIAKPIIQGSLPCIDKDSALRNFSVNVEGLTVLDAYVEITKTLIQVYVFKKDPVQILNDTKNLVEKWNEKESVLTGFNTSIDNEFESNSPLMQDEQFEQNLEPTMDDVALTEEDVEFINQYGIDAKTHSDVVEFLNSEEWRLIQGMMSNTLSKSDSTQ